MMASKDVIDENEMHLLKLMKMSHGISCSVMYKIFLWGTEQKPGESVKDYLLKKKKWTMTEYRKYFDSYQMKNMSDRTLECKFDVTTLFKVIKVTCAKVDSSATWTEENDEKLERLVTAIKNFRNNLSHGFHGIAVEEFLQKSLYLMDLLKGALTLVGCKYERPEQEVHSEIKKMEEDIKSVRDQMIATSDVSKFEVILLNERWKNFLKKEGAQELRKRYEHMCQLNPIHFLESEGMHLDINMVFTQIEVVKAGKKPKDLQVPCHEILAFCRDNTNVKSGTPIHGPEMYLIEGPAGAGKTTLMKKMKAVWSNKDRFWQGLDDFDLLLFMECRNPTLSSLSDLLGHLMPEMKAKLREGDLLKFTLDLKTLILIDGLDELNSNSEKLFLDIINQNNRNLVILCTSRPEKTGHFQSLLPPTFHTAHLKIIGIADNKREEFVTKYHEEMKKQGRSMRDTESLIRYIKRSESHLKNHYRLPLNLVLLTWLWADDPGSVTPLTTSSELYIQTHNLMKKKLLKRLAPYRDDDKVINKKLKEVSCSIYKAALDSLSRDAIDSLLPESVEQMEATCKANELPHRETLSAFLVIRDVEGKEKVSAPHKLLHDFYAAQCIVQNLFNENQEGQDTVVLQGLAVFLNNQDLTPAMRQKLLSRFGFEMTQNTTALEPGSLRTLITDLNTNETGKINKYQSMLLHVAGIIYALHQSKVETWIAKEIVELLKDSELGLKDNNQWFDLFELTKNDPTVIRDASYHISKSITITDERVKAALELLLTAKPKRISVSIIGKTQDIPDLQILMSRIAACKSKLDLSFWQDFWNPVSLPSNDQQLRTVSSSCSLGKVTCHVSGSILAEVHGSSTFLNLAVTSDQAAQEVMAHLDNSRPNLLIAGLGLHLSRSVSPQSLRKVMGIGTLCLAVSGVQDSDLENVCDMAKAILPEEFMLLDLRFPRAEATYAGWMNLLKKMKEIGISAGNISIPEEAVLLQNEYESLKDFAFSELPVRGAFRKLSKEQMWEGSFSAI